MVWKCPPHPPLKPVPSTFPLLGPPIEIEEPELPETHRRLPQPPDTFESRRRAHVQTEGAGFSKGRPASAPDLDCRSVPITWLISACIQMHVEGSDLSFKFKEGNPSAKARRKAVRAVAHLALYLPDSELVRAGRAGIWRHPDSRPRREGEAVRPSGQTVGRGTC